ncbi:hypothetical protein MRB53_024602 [Persea americana]|uniref:Uncharacterized protein n=1 Tax=Persea americana TaxID=3435 RepID=A0ACC2LCV5_PERAE|nr:hypothetical protein MRB53_024602 [Persea americana]
MVDFFSNHASSLVHDVGHRGNAWVRRTLLVTASFLHTTRFRIGIFSFFLFLPLVHTKFENQESPSSLSFSGKEQQQSSGPAASLDRLQLLLW